MMFLIDGAAGTAGGAPDETAIDPRSLYNRRKSCETAVHCDSVL